MVKDFCNCNTICWGLDVFRGGIDVGNANLLVHHSPETNQNGNKLQN